MAPKNSKSNLSPKATKDPTISTSLPAVPNTNKKLDRIDIEKAPQVSFKTKCCTFLYNKKENTFCGRTCISWVYLIAYSIMYLMFLCTYSMICLYAALSLIKLTVDFSGSNYAESLTYSEFKIGLTATPTSVTHQPLIWYRLDHEEDYQKYVQAIRDLFNAKKTKDVAKLGPCGKTPYGYGESPCIILRINKHLLWSGKPLEANSTESDVAPLEVQDWMKKDKKLWLHCSGYHSYDKEHLGRITYFPDPPGFDSDLFPPTPDSEIQLIAIQLSGFTLDVSLVVECKLWYERGPSTTEFILYVSGDRNLSNRSNI